MEAPVVGISPYKQPEIECVKLFTKTLKKNVAKKIRQINGDLFAFFPTHFFASNLIGHFTEN